MIDTYLLGDPDEVSLVFLFFLSGILSKLFFRFDLVLSPVFVSPLVTDAAFVGSDVDWLVLCGCWGVVVAVLVVFVCCVFGTVVGRICRGGFFSGGRFWLVGVEIGVLVMVFLVGCLVGVGLCWPMLLL